MIKQEEIENMPEAVSSVTYSLTTPAGFGILLTVKRNDENELLKVMKDMDVYLKGLGYTPKAEKSGYTPKPKEIVQGETCPKCGSSLVKFTTKDGLKSGVKCSTAKWDFVNKVKIGCDFVRWDKQTNYGSFETGY
jgi:predicted Zn-ribbon and HTH transcriptional regulator